MSAGLVERSLLIPVSPLIQIQYQHGLGRADEEGTFGKYLFNPIVAAQNFEYKVSCSPSLEKFADM